MNAASDTARKIITAAILVIGDEILSGRTKDKNIGYIAEYLTNIGIDLSEVRVVLEAHAAYLAALPGHPAPGDFIPKFTAMSGKAMGVEHAVLFRAHDLQAPPAL